MDIHIIFDTRDEEYQAAIERLATTMQAASVDECCHADNCVRLIGIQRAATRDMIERFRFPDWEPNGPAAVFWLLSPQTGKHFEGDIITEISR